MLLPEVSYHLLENAIARSVVSSTTECFLKCRITSYRTLLSEVSYRLPQNASWSAVSPITECCCLKCRITSYRTLLSEVSYRLPQNVIVRSVVSPTTEYCLKCRIASYRGANLQVIVFLHNTKQTCVERDCFGRLGSECHSEPIAALWSASCFKNSEYAESRLGVVTYREGCKLHKLMVLQNRKTHWDLGRV